MVSKEVCKRMLTNSESDSEAAPSTALEVKDPSEGSRQVRKRNKALQVRFKDICEAQSEQAAAARGGAHAPYQAAYRKYMTVPARRSIPNVTKSTGVQTSPDLRKRYQTFPLERKKSHTVKHAAAVESYKDQDDGFVVDVKRAKAAEGGGRAERAERACGVRKTRALLHTRECVATIEHHPRGGDCADRTRPDGQEPDYQVCAVRSRHRKSGQSDSGSPEQAGERQLLNSEDGGGGVEGGAPADPASKVTGPIAWNSLTQVECLESPSARNKRKQQLQLNGLQVQTLPRTGCTTRAQCHADVISARTLRAMEEATASVAAAPAAMPTPPCEGGTGAGGLQTDSEACKQIVPVHQDRDVKAQLQAMENMINSSQETIKVLLGVIQELEKGEALREGLSYRTGQDTANCDTCRNSACIIYSVELDFKQQEDKLQPLMKRLCSAEDAPFSSLPYPQEALSSTPRRKAKGEAKKHARWKLWFL
ncbi:inhibitory synaptic factor 2A [Brachyhypopomus gauderio]|uniref:inhibitory synaptic factor 2A n=1 Tax=Brachyhypopomus gauderio TaxID=698409 RepID=UPI0040433639